MKKIDWIDGAEGLQADWGNGDYTITIWQDIDSEDGYDVVFCRANTDLAHRREQWRRLELVDKMRGYQSDLRRWRKVKYNS